LQWVAAETLPLDDGEVVDCAAVPITPAPTKAADNRRVFNMEHSLTPPDKSNIGIKEPDKRNHIFDSRPERKTV
jgi:folate-dependent phosphoribosylglycinamide formyltransferase PurN